MGEQRAADDFVICGRRQFKGSDTHWKILPGLAADGHYRAKTELSRRKKTNKQQNKDDNSGSTIVELKRFRHSRIFCWERKPSVQKVHEPKDTKGITNVKASSCCAC